MNDKNRSDLWVLSAILLVLLAATFGVVLRFGETGRPAEPQESKRVQEWRNQLTVLLNLRRFTDAEIVAERILKARPDDVDMLRTAGRLCYLNGKYRESVPLLHRVSVMDPGNAADRCNYALALACTGRSGQALSELRRAFRDSGSADYVYRLFNEIASRSSYSGVRLDEQEVMNSPVPEGLLGLPEPKKGKKK